MTQGLPLGTYIITSTEDTPKGVVCPGSAGSSLQLADPDTTSTNQQWQITPESSTTSTMSSGNLYASVAQQAPASTLVTVTSDVSIFWVSNLIAIPQAPGTFTGTVQTSDTNMYWNIASGNVQLQGQSYNWMFTPVPT